MACRVAEGGMFGRSNGVQIKLSGNGDGTGVLSYHNFRCVQIKVPSSAFTVRVH